VLLLVPVLFCSSLAGCSRSSTSGASDAPPILASSDPQGNDLVEGAIVTAAESSGGYRLYKIIHIENRPEPFGTEDPQNAYDPKGATIAESAQLFRQGKATVALDHIEVRKVHFMKRDHRVIGVSPPTEAERAPYLKARDSRK